uniref:SDR family NAD(P)-dependent oxidoreductase n=1 Tax=Lactiplantibacillus plantarum TaxID=1590 RepID=UPI00156F410F|nr:SDR family oxidoreductase [Lactiplantibacillus plantarum]MBY7656478.1 SDR family oxidoreductase [Lactiplantibacillus plantarum]QKK58452.1 SDR family oxidoreductase [Lactiplantibacillus plantarum]QSE52171.1 SDR family oxidoreductase [Lactiplantibacillus plantarum]
MRALVTGISGDLGLSIAKKLLQKNIDVIGVYRTEDGQRMKRIRQQTNTFDGKLKLIQVDLAILEDIKKVIDKEVQKVDILVNNAGISKSNLLVNTSLADIHRTLLVNLEAQIVLTQVVLPKMIFSKNPSIVNISSVVGIYGNNGQTIYAASKGGVIGFTHSLAQEYGKLGIRANAVSPGYLTSGIAKSMTNQNKTNKAEMSLLNRLGTVEEVANVAVFLALPTSSYVNDQVIVVDGGRKS